ncbi:unnamed protein product [Mytilus edulis]|uniref:Uncharacterized protein n=1 Tax=Mytilus edulis TaxID=6550 RepID=A0A8S3VB76_MYTED|nr:unnamed protein product [Mytilus edulis]
MKRISNKKSGKIQQNDKTTDKGITKASHCSTTRKDVCRGKQKDNMSKENEKIITECHSRGRPKKKVDNVNPLPEDDLQHIDWSLQGSVFVLDNDLGEGNQHVLRRSLRSILTPNKPKIQISIDDDKEINDDDEKQLKTTKKGKKRRTKTKLKLTRPVVYDESSGDSLYNPQLRSTGKEDILVPASMLKNSSDSSEDVTSPKTDLDGTSSDELPDLGVSEDNHELISVTTGSSMESLGDSPESSVSSGSLETSHGADRQGINHNKAEKLGKKPGQKSKAKGKKKKIPVKAESGVTDEKKVPDRDRDILKVNYMDKVIQEQQRILDIIKNKSPLTKRRGGLQRHQNKDSQNGDTLRGQAGTRTQIMRLRSKNNLLDENNNDTNIESRNYNTSPTVNYSSVHETKSMSPKNSSNKEITSGIHLTDYLTEAGENLWHDKEGCDNGTENLDNKDLFSDESHTYLSTINDKSQTSLTGNNQTHLSESVETGISEGNSNICINSQDANQDIIYIISDESDGECSVLLVSQDDVENITSNQLIQDRNIFDWANVELLGGTLKTADTNGCLENTSNNSSPIYVHQHNIQLEDGSWLPNGFVKTEYEDNSCPDIDHEVTLPHTVDYTDQTDDQGHEDISYSETCINHLEEEEEKTLVYTENVDNFYESYSEEDVTLTVHVENNENKKSDIDTLNVCRSQSRFTDGTNVYEGDLKTVSNVTIPAIGTKSSVSNETDSLIGGESSTTNVTESLVSGDSSLPDLSLSAFDVISNTSNVTTSIIGGNLALPDITSDIIGAGDSLSGSTDSNIDVTIPDLSKTEILQSDSDFTVSSVDSGEVINENDKKITMALYDNNNKHIVVDTNGIRHLPDYEKSGETNSGLIFYDSWTIPYVLVNGYKYTISRDVLPLVFQIDQLICSSKRGPVRTGELMLRFDMFVTKIADIRATITDKHRNTKLKNSQLCHY